MVDLVNAEPQQEQRMATAPEIPRLPPYRSYRSRAFCWSDENLQVNDVLVEQNLSPLGSILLFVAGIQKKSNLVFWPKKITSGYPSELVLPKLPFSHVNGWFFLHLGECDLILGGFFY